MYCTIRLIYEQVCLIYELRLPNCIITEAYRDVICLPNVLQRKSFIAGTFQVLLHQMEIQFMHSGIQPCKSNAQISMNNLLNSAL